jgi:hypothetical protein
MPLWKILLSLHRSYQADHAFSKAIVEGVAAHSSPPGIEATIGSPAAGSEQDGTTEEGKILWNKAPTRHGRFSVNVSQRGLIIGVSGETRRG